MSKIQIKEVIEIGGMYDSYSIEYLQNFIKDNIPAQYQEFAKIEVDKIIEYGDELVKLNVYYYRHETDEELEERSNKAEKAAQAITEREKQELERLLKKYPQ